jgi:hypothetical protein
VEINTNGQCVRSTHRKVLPRSPTMRRHMPIAKMTVHPANDASRHK